MRSSGTLRKSATSRRPGTTNICPPVLEVLYWTKHHNVFVQTIHLFSDRTPLPLLADIDQFYGTFLHSLLRPLCRTNLAAALAGRFVKWSLVYVQNKLVAFEWLICIVILFKVMLSQICPILLRQLAGSFAKDSCQSITVGWIKSLPTRTTGLEFRWRQSLQFLNKIVQPRFKPQLLVGNHLLILDLLQSLINWNLQ